MKTNRPTLQYIRECFFYEMSTGFIYWKKRPLEHFKNAATANSENMRLSGKRAGRTRVKADIKLTGICIPSAHIVWLLHHDKWPSTAIFYNDGNPLNCRIDNLSLIRPRPVSKNDLPTGIFYLKRSNKFKAVLRNKYGVRKTVGVYSTVHEAEIARAGQKIGGEFALRRW